MPAKIKWLVYVAVALLACYLTYMYFFVKNEPMHLANSKQPNIIITAVPKSGSKYLMLTFRNNLGYKRIKPVLLDKNLEHSSNASIPAISQPASIIVKEHFRPPVNLDASNRFNYPIFDLQAAQANGNKMVLHLRDPRQVLLSLIHHIQDRDYPNISRLISPASTRAWFEKQDLATQVDWGIDNLLPKIVNWINDWLYFKELEDQKPDGLRILITTYDELTNNEKKLYQKILSFYDVAYNKSVYTAPPKNHSTHFRKGDPSEWQRVYNAAQKQKISQIVPQELLDRFGWNRPKVFQIGFNKCGTTTLSDFFNANDIKSIHYSKGEIAASIYHNYKHGLPLLSAEYDQYTGYFDLTTVHTDPPIDIGYELYQELDKQYPGSKFILNIRNKEAWLKSRSNHRTKYNMTYLELVARKYNISTDAVIKRWSQQWDMHISEVKEYFKNRPQDLLVFDIEQDPPEKLAEFFKSVFKLNPELYVHKNKTRH